MAVGARLYYVEDSIAVRDRVCCALERLGIEIAGVASGADQAIAEIPRLRPDIVVLDVNLAEGTGMQILRELRLADPRPTVVMLTNVSDPVVRRHSRQAGADYFFDKSTQFDEFLRLIEELARTSR